MNGRSKYISPIPQGVNHDLCVVPKFPGICPCMSMYVYLYGYIVWLRALRSTCFFELVIEFKEVRKHFAEVVHIRKKLCTSHRSGARFTSPSIDIHIKLLWDGQRDPQRHGFRYYNGPVTWIVLFFLSFF